MSSSVLLHQFMVPGDDSSDMLVVLACFRNRIWIHALIPSRCCNDFVMVTVQEEGYQAALECNGLALLQTQIKVEPCISAGPKTKNKGALAGQANGGHADSAPKAGTCALCKLQITDTR